MYSFIKETHNIIGMAVLLILLGVLIISIFKLLQKKPFDKTSKTAARLGLIAIHLQILFGLILYFVSPYGFSNFSGEAMKETIPRFYLVEHPVGMILAAVLITIGFSRAKKPNFSDAKKFKQIIIFYGIGFIIVSKFIPWFVWK
ncbi:MAG: hypothetical protein H3C39_10905 [Flavobacteriia bacterium]|nr:hypothetical protein [Flavobacteriia bacterium]